MSDRLFREFIQRQPSCLSRRFSEYLESGEGRNPACHVRRAKTSGTGIKGDYCCIPLTSIEHDVQSRNGELACLKEFLPPATVANLFGDLTNDEAVLLSKAWFDARVEEYLQRWVDTLKKTTSWQQLPQEV